MGSFSVCTDNGRRLFLAYTCDRLARHLLHQRHIRKEKWLQRKALNRFDFDCPELGISVEVKGSSNNNPIQWFTSQLEAQLKELGFSTEPPPIVYPPGFPMDTGVHVIFNYRNRIYSAEHKKMSGHLLHHSCQTPLDQKRFLTENIITAFVVDIRLLSALRWNHGSRRYHWGAERRLIAVNRKNLRSVANSTREVLETLGLAEQMDKWLPPNADRIQSRMIETALDGYPMRFELVPLLPLGLRTRFIKHLNGSVKAVVP